jgi:hypothetical protein
MVIWEDCTEHDYEEGRPPSARSAGQGAIEIQQPDRGEKEEEETEACDTGMGGDAGGEGADAVGSIEEVAGRTDKATSTATTSAPASTCYDGTCGGFESSTSAGAKTIRCERAGEVKADLHIHLPNCTEDADIGMAVGLALAQLIRGRRVPVEVSAMGEAGVDGQLVPDEYLGKELLTLEIAKKVITVQHEVNKLKVSFTASHIL